MDTGDEKAQRIAYLIAGYIRQTLTPQEHDELDEWVEQSEENMLLFEELTDEKNIQAGIAALKKKDSVKAWQKIRNKLPFEKKIQTRRFWPYAVAASIILLVIASYFFIPFRNSPVSPSPIAASKPDLPPGSNKAVLTLADGKAIILENQLNGKFVNEGGLQVEKIDSGHIAYNNTDVARADQWNTLSTPRGGQYMVTLSDGTMVWLNAATSLKYSVAFAGKERRVELDGEAYFEVAHDAARPFHVISKNQDITVLGTRFNVDAYSDEPLVTTSLIEGKISLSSQNEKQVVLPGEQYFTQSTGSIQKNPSPDIEQATAWKNGRFYFKNAAIEPILKEVSRWYDANIVYQGKIDKHFNADISRKLPVSQLLDLLEKTGGVHFDIEPNKINVRP